MDNLNSNPFDSNSNPFEDVSVTEARKAANQSNKNPTNPEGDLGQFNPFDKKQEPATINPSVSVSIDNQGTSSSNITEEIKKKQEDLEKKAAELDRREQSLNQSAGHLKNFPPIPSICPFKPCFRQDINIDIPQRFQQIVRFHFYIWMAFYVLMLLNLIAALAYIIVNSSTTSGSTFGLSILYFCLFPPLAYAFWFRGVYNAFRNDSSFNFFVYFFIFFIHNCLLVIWCVGIPGSGGVGFISGIATSQANKGVGVYMIIIGILFGFMGGIGFFLMLKVLYYYRNSGASFQKAQEEMAAGVFSNSTVQRTAVNVMTDGGNLENRY